MGSFVPSTAKERREMLAALGLTREEEKQQGEKQGAASAGRHDRYSI